LAGYRYNIYGGRGGMTVSSKFGASKKVGRGVYFGTGESLFKEGKSKIGSRNRFELMKFFRFRDMFRATKMRSVIGMVFTRIQMEMSRILIANLKDSIRKNGWHPHHWLTSVIANRRHPLLRDKRNMYKSISFKPMPVVAGITSFWVGFPADKKGFTGSRKTSSLNIAQIAQIHDQRGASMRVTKKCKDSFLKFYMKIQE